MQQQMTVRLRVSARLLPVVESIAIPGRPCMSSQLSPDDHSTTL